MKGTAASLAGPEERISGGLSLDTNVLFSRFFFEVRLLLFVVAVVVVAAVFYVIVGYFYTLEGILPRLILRISCQKVQIMIHCLTNQHAVVVIVIVVVIIFVLAVVVFIVAPAVIAVVIVIVFI